MLPVADGLLIEPGLGVVMGHQLGLDFHGLGKPLD
jgi:hypothetical protein